MCEFCNQNAGHWDVDPYASDLYGDNTPVYICDECIGARAREI